MTLIHAWVVYPLVVLALGAGWGALIEKAAGTKLHGALLVPVGMVAVIVVSGFFTAFSGTASWATPICGVGAVIGLGWGRPWERLRRPSIWPALGAIGALLAYGAPVLATLHPTWLGYLRLDDTGTWFDVTDVVMSHARNLASLPTSTFTLVFTGDVGGSYPLGAFQLYGVSHTLAGIDLAWVFDPYMACCGAAIALSVYALAEPFVSSPRLRAFIGFVAAQPALLYGYYLWGGIKEITAAMVVSLGAAMIAPMLRERPGRDRELTPLGVLAIARQMIPLGVVTGGLMTILNAGAAAWAFPAFAILLGAWGWQAFGERRASPPPKPAKPAPASKPKSNRPSKTTTASKPADAKPRGVGQGLLGPTVSVGALLAIAAACAVPMWIVLKTFLQGDAGLFSANQTSATLLGNLIHPVSGWQLFGTWAVGDFRNTAPTFPTAFLIGLAILVATLALMRSLSKGQLGLALYSSVVLIGALIVSAQGATPWVMGKSLAISSPGVMAVALIGAGMLLEELWKRFKWLGAAPAALVMALLAFGVVYSNILGYHDATIAPYQRMAELEHIGSIDKGKGPVFVNDYEIYADRHFLRDEAPVEPAEYRAVLLPLSDGRLLVKPAFADLDSFAPSTLLPYRSIVTRNSPVESRPPSIYKLVYKGKFYELWVRPANPTQRIIVHLPLGDQAQYPYCGAAENGAPNLPLCSIAPAAVPPCITVQTLAKVATQNHAQLLAYQRPEPIVIRGDNLQWPVQWFHDPVGHTLTANTPGSATAHIQIRVTQNYRFWIAGLFSRGFDISIDGHSLGRVANEISDINGYVPVGTLHLTANTVHTIKFTYPSPGLGPGQGENQFNMLDEFALEPVQPSFILKVPPSQASTLCNKPLDWIEVVSGA
ncbi:MAG: hypothetical protein ACYDHH_16375 [Solirubrobacteraceae bacterium]